MLDTLPCFRPYLLKISSQFYCATPEDADVRNKRAHVHSARFWGTDPHVVRNLYMGTQQTASDYVNCWGYGGVVPAAPIMLDGIRTRQYADAVALTDPSGPQARQAIHYAAKMGVLIGAAVGLLVVGLAAACGALPPAFGLFALAAAATAGALYLAHNERCHYDRAHLLFLQLHALSQLYEAIVAAAEMSHDDQEAQRMVTMEQLHRGLEICKQGIEQSDWAVTQAALELQAEIEARALLVPAKALEQQSHGVQAYHGQLPALTL